MENEMREDIKKALKFVEYAVFSALIIGSLLFINSSTHSTAFWL